MLPLQSNGEHTGTVKIFASGQSTMQADAPLMENDFYFAQHWRGTSISLDVSSIMDGNGAFVGSVAVLNQWGDRTLKHFSC